MNTRGMVIDQEIRTEREKNIGKESFFRNE
jgi:hypothetical protein